MKDKIKEVVLDLVFVISGCFIAAYAINGIMIPNGLSAGGITGIARIIQQYVPVSFSVVYYLLAMCVLIACFFTLGSKDAKRILLMSLLFPAMLLLLENVDFYLLESKDMFLSSVFYGVVGGAGTGLIYKRGFSYGGSDTIAKIINKKFLNFVSLSQILLVIDAVIIIGSGIVFGRNIALYSLVAQLVFIKSIDFIIYGFGSKNIKIEIISDRYKDIEDFAINELNRGLSRYEIIGSYTGEKKIKLTCICSPRESMLIKGFISRESIDAFVSIIPINSVWGRGVGFANIDDD